MKQMCAWCGRQLGSSDGPPVNDEPPVNDISYGICLPCANAVIANIPNDLDDFLNQISVPIVLVDIEGKVKTANHKACELLGKELSALCNMSGGQVFECAYAMLPGGCGNTYHCSGCVIRRSVMSTFETGKPVYRMPAAIKQRVTGEQQEIRFLISTEKFDDCVILRIYGEGTD